MKKLNNVIALIGPTASGKSDLAIELALALDSEIISADSRLVYEDFNIGTAKPTFEELAKVKHHCVDIVSPLDDFSVSNYMDFAKKGMKDLFSDNKVPVVAGGTGFYVKSLLGELDIPKVEPNVEFRQKMQDIIKQYGKEYLHNILREKDEITAKKLHYNDSFRVIRALEVIDSLGIPMSSAQKKKNNDFNVIYIFLDAKDRAFLYDRINRRVDIMIELGLVEEVKNLILKYGKTISLLKTLGYKEVSEYLDGVYSFDEMKELIKKNTRNFAKRQLTWFRAVQNTHKFYIDELDKEELLLRVKDKCLSMML